FRSSPDPSKLYQAAFEHHAAGRLADAEALYRKILAANPHHPDALHWLGVLAHQCGQHPVAIDLISRAIMSAAAARGVAPASYYANLAMVFNIVGRTDDAIEASRAALRIDPQLAAAHNILGVALQSRGQLNEAIESFREA